MKKLRVGDELPECTLLNQSEKKVHLHHLVKNHPATVIFFYPRNNSFLCVKQACALRDHYQHFKEKNIAILGVSPDSPKSHTDFIDRHGFPFQLLSDRSQELIAQLVSFRWSFFPPRVTCIISPECKITHMYSSPLSVSGHVKTAKKALSLSPVPVT